MLDQHAKSWHSENIFHLLATTYFSNLKCAMERKEKEEDTVRSCRRMAPVCLLRLQVVSGLFRGSFNSQEDCLLRLTFL